MRKKGARKRDKPYFSHDENLEFLELKKYCSHQALFTSVIRIMKGRGAKDPNIIEACEKEDFHAVTHNTRDFEETRKDFRLGVVCVGLVDKDIWIPKFSRMLRKLRRHDQYYFKNIYIRDIITTLDRKTEEIRII